MLPYSQKAVGEISGAPTPSSIKIIRQTRHKTSTNQVGSLASLAPVKFTVGVNVRLI